MLFHIRFSQISLKTSRFEVSVPSVPVTVLQAPHLMLYTFEDVGLLVLRSTQKLTAEIN